MTLDTTHRAFVAHASWFAKITNCGYRISLKFVGLLVKSIFKKLISCLPKGRLQTAAIKGILRHRIGAPRELMINRGDTVVQVGMWREEALLQVANLIGNEGKLLLIELFPAATETARQVFSTNNFSNATVVNKGAWHSPDKLKVIESPNPAVTRIDTGRLHPGESEGAKTIYLDVDTIDNICAQNGIGNIDYMEITINGAELEAIKGASEALRKTKRVWVAGLTRDSESGEPLNKGIAEALRSLGFQTRISRSKRSKTQAWESVDGHVFGWRGVDAR